MTLWRVLLFALTALALVGAIYFWMIKIAAAAMALLLLVVLGLGAVIFLRGRAP